MREKQKGITLIALIITIIIMLILVAVSIFLVINSGLIDKTREAGEATRTAYRNESHYGEQGQITISGVTYNSIAEYEAVLNGGANPGANDTLTLAVQEIPTESRASIVTVSIDVEEPDPSDLAELDTTEEGATQVQEVFATACSIYWNLEYSWEDVVAELEDYGYEDIDTVTAAFDAYVDYGDIDGEEYSSPYAFIIAQKVYIPKATFTCNGQRQENVREAAFIITNPGTYTIVATANGETGRTTFTPELCKVEEFSEICNEITELKAGANGIVTPVTSPSDTVVAVVPAGFAYGTSENVGKVSTGLVITDSVETVENTHYSTGNEFVWIPVDYTPADGNNPEIIAVAGKEMARISSGTNYQGVLYDFSGTGTETTSKANNSYTASNTDSYGEPRILMDTSSINTEIEPHLDLQNKYNTMIASVKNAGGFYVGRYELGAGDNNDISKLGVTPATAEDGYDWETEEGGLTWYGLYAKAGSYVHPNSTAYPNTVTSHMIWGSQYDAMLNFALEGNDKGKVGSTGLGNHTSVPVATGTAIPTSPQESSTYDKILNIYDLQSNQLEWTAEASYTHSRITRGRRTWLWGRRSSYPSQLQPSD